jgi:hypothetical protein
MPIIQMNINDLKSRVQKIRVMLRPISKQKDGPACELTNSSSSRLIFAIHDGARPISDYRDWRFSTKVESFYAMYFELWKRNEKDEELWYLDRAYLSIYQFINRQEKEFLCLHCDPNIASELEESENKQEKISNKANLKLEKKGLISNKILSHSKREIDRPEKERYKKGPHLHIKAAEDPLPHAHFALNLGHLNDVLASVESLSDAMKDGILMLREEVLDRL